MRAALMIASAAALSGCGGSGGSSGGSVPVVAAPAPTPSPSPSPTASPTPTPTASYQTYAQLTGDRTFRTGCGTLIVEGGAPLTRPVSPFGTGLTLAYAAGTQTWTVSADTNAATDFGPQARSYGPADRDAGVTTAGTTSYLKTATGFQERLTIGTPSANGASPDYLRGLSLRTPRYGNITAAAMPVQYACIFGVPTRIDDAPRTGGTVTFTRTGFNGVAYAQTGIGTSDIYALDRSQVTFSVDLDTFRVTTSVRLVGVLQTAAGPAATTTEFGTFSGTITIDEAGYYNGLLSSNGQIATFGGWFFGPQGAEAGYAFSLVRQDSTGRRFAAIGNAVALR